MVNASDVAVIEAWANSAYSGADDGKLVARPRGTDVVLVEQWTLRGLERSRQVLKIRWVAKSEVWTLQWVLGGGRWMGERPNDDSLGRLLDAIDLGELPSH